MKRFCICLVLLILAVFLSESSLYAQDVLRYLRTCQIKVKPGDVSASYIDPVTGTRFLIPLPKPKNSFDQKLQSYNIALCNRLDRGEISKEEFKTLLDAMIAGKNEEKQKLAIELQKQSKQENQRRQLQYKNHLQQWQEKKAYYACITSAQKAYRKRWSETCRRFNLKHGRWDANCWLDLELAGSLGADLRRQENFCLSLHRRK